MTREQALELTERITELGLAVRLDGMTEVGVAQEEEPQIVEWEVSIVLYKASVTLVRKALDIVAEGEWRRTALDGDRLEVL
jgi:hypothetical protein